ncbi:uncharacterized protein LOC143855903 [Tasmannia lanceolata]|uniref:uncharacterized protein LOC143855903 n=1 Tax=Tasmannia lanceolata TaxID=3420 RepID=UPI0040628E25
MSQAREEGVTQPLSPHAMDVHQHASQAQEEGTSSNKKKKNPRGRTKLDHLYKMEGRLPVNLNKFKQVVGKNACKCGKFLGVIAKIGSILPINVFSWKNMPESNREDAWSTLLEKFDVPIDGKDWVMIQLNEKWKYFKYTLRKKYFDKSSEEVIFPPKLDGIVESQYIALWNYWKTDDFQTKSTANIANRNSSWIPHTAGSKAFTIIIEEEEETTKTTLPRDELWIKTRTSKDGKLVTDSSEDVVKKIRELQGTQPMDISQGSTACNGDILSQAMGPDTHGRVRCLGKGPTPSTLWGKKSHRETTKSKNEVILQNKVANLEEELRQVKEILIQNAIIGRNVDLPNQVHSSVASRVDQPDAHVAQSYIVPPVAPHTNPLALPTSLPPIAPTNTPIDVPTIPFSKAPRTAPVVGQVTRASPRAKARNNKTHECIPCKLKNSEGKFVAKGFFKNEDPTLIIGGKKLGEGWCVVTINGGISREAKLPRPTGKMQVIADALGSNVAWPRAYVKLLNGK